MQLQMKMNGNKKSKRGQLRGRMFSARDVRDRHKALAKPKTDTRAGYTPQSAACQQKPRLAARPDASPGNARGWCAAGRQGHRYEGWFGCLICFFGCKSCILQPGTAQIKEDGPDSLLTMTPTLCQTVTPGKLQRFPMLHK